MKKAQPIKYFIMIDGKKMKDRNGKIINYSDKDAQMITEQWQSQGIDAKYGCNIPLSDLGW
tara:strand:- start:338 stop:520 length:183 start_codon:yes stop_codon:yes gene_type:complete